MELLQHTASLTGGFCNATPHCLAALGSSTHAMHCLTDWGKRACHSCKHCLTALGQWAVELVQNTASLPEGNGKCNSCNVLPQCLGPMGSGTVATHCLTVWGLLQRNASLPGGIGQFGSCNA